MPGKRGVGLSLLLGGAGLCLVGLFFLPLVILGSLLMIVGGAVFARSFLDL